jgi:RNA polymerase sigma-70 factor (ECF subfamily)
MMEQKLFIEIVLPLRPRLMAYAGRFMDNPDDAEDITQEVMLKLWCMKGELGAYRNIAALSVLMTKHLCLNALKAKQRRLAGLADAVEEEQVADSPHTALEEKDSLAHVSQIIARLPGLQQAILKMKHIEGLEIEEIAAITGSSPVAVRMNLSRARKKVKDLFFKINR